MPKQLLVVTPKPGVKLADVCVCVCVWVWGWVGVRMQIQMLNRTAGFNSLLNILTHIQHTQFISKTHFYIYKKSLSYIMQIYTCFLLTYKFTSCQQLSLSLTCEQKKRREPISTGLRNTMSSTTWITGRDLLSKTQKNQIWLWKILPNVRLEFLMKM